MTKYSHPVFGWKAHKLADLPMAALVQLREEIISDPANANPDYAAGRSIYLYTPAARKRLDALAWAVTYRLNADKAQQAQRREIAQMQRQF